MDIVNYIQQFPTKTFRRGELLLQKGDPGVNLMAIRDGFVKVSSINANGVERLLWIAGRYDLTPTEQLFSKHNQVRFFYTALTDGSYYNVDKKELLTIAQNEPAVMAEIAKNMALHYDDFLQRVDAVDTATVKERLMRTLCYLAERLDSNETVDLYSYGLKLSHQELSEMIGSSRETTSLMLSELRKADLVRYSRQKLTVCVDKIKTLLGD
ncbi:MAG: transcriptional regulator, Crp/Fnr family [Candidatus Saccharibacteria bacterium]|nr:transcriptional regulator, Crp/Fnr family [Candidatus Saccharibacteria bacterium]MDB5180546.1 transcriptional regulator, Crp/Fnr family [Candidatus Saccharibacteria bacterium]